MRGGLALNLTKTVALQNLFFCCTPERGVRSINSTSDIEMSPVCLCIITGWGDVQNWQLDSEHCSMYIWSDVLFLLIFNLNHELAAFLWIFKLFCCSFHVQTKLRLCLWLSTLWLFRYDLRQWNSSNPWYIAAASGEVYQRKMNINNIPNDVIKHTRPTILTQYICRKNYD